MLHTDQESDRIEKIWWFVVSAVVAAVTIGIAIELAKWAGWFARKTVENAVENTELLLALLGC